MKMRMGFFASGLLLAATFTYAEQPIGRLFSTPAERSSLDYLRQTKKPNTPLKIETPLELAEPAPIVLPDAINMQGYVKRNDGKLGTVWINNQAMQENSANQDVQVGRLPENSNRVPIKLPANGKRLNLKAGQVYDPENNRVREARSYAIQSDVGRIGNDDTP